MEYILDWIGPEWNEQEPDLRLMICVIYFTYLYMVRDALIACLYGAQCCLYKSDSCL